MSEDSFKFDTFIQLMEKNWSRNNQKQFYIFPRMVRVGSYLEQQVSEVMEAQGLLSSDFHLISAIRRSNSKHPFELMPSELCNYMLFSWGGLTKIMKRLEEKGIISRVSSSNDKRIRMIRLTEKGQLIVDNSLDKLEEMHHQLLSNFTTDECQQFDKLLAKLLKNIESR